MPILEKEKVISPVIAPLPDDGAMYSLLGGVDYATNAGITVGAVMTGGNLSATVLTLSDLTRMVDQFQQTIYTSSGAQTALGQSLHYPTIIPNSFGAQTQYQVDGWYTSIGSLYGAMQYQINQVSNVWTNIVTAGFGWSSFATPEELAVHQEREAARAAKFAAAESRAEQLMLSLLMPDQVQQYKDHGYFETLVDDRVYRIKKGRAGNVELIVKGKPAMRYCAHPLDWTPAPDAMIAQFLMLKTNEKKFIETANKTQLAA